MSSVLDDLFFLEALERHGAAAPAARELNVAPSTVYRRMTALETSLGVQCVERGGGVTPAGRELANVARRARGDVADVVRRATARKVEAEGKVTITTVEGMAPLLTGAIAELSRSYPRLRLELELSDEGLSVRDREADIAISVLPNPPPSLVGRRLTTIRYGVYTARSGDEPTEDRLPWIVLAPPMHSTPQARWERRHVLKRDIAVATGSRLAFLELVRSGIGRGVLPCPLASRYADLTEVVEGVPSLKALRRPVWLLTRPELRRTTRVALVIDALSTLFESTD